MHTVNIQEVGKTSDEKLAYGVQPQSPKLTASGGQMNANLTQWKRWRRELSGDLAHVRRRLYFYCFGNLHSNCLMKLMIGPF